MGNDREADGDHRPALSGGPRAVTPDQEQRMADRPRPRAGEAGLRLGSLPPGPLDAIVDVPGVRVGHVSLLAGEATRTGVTAILSHPGDPFREKTPAAAFVLNGFGKTCGLPQLQELGVLETPVLLTGTLNVPRVADALIDWTLRNNPEVLSVNPVVGECNDGYLNDVRARPVRAEHVFAAIECAGDGPVEEGAVGAGVGMTCYGFKGGVGTASRVVEVAEARFTLGALVLANFGDRLELRIGGAPVGRELAALAGGGPPGHPQAEGGGAAEALGSAMVILATDAPLDARQLQRLARRGGLGLARTGSSAGHGSGDFIIAFSNAETVPHRPPSPVLRRSVLAEDGPAITRLFQATVESVEEAVVNALFRAETVAGRDGHVRRALPLEPALAVLRRYGQLA
jgi:D-aminopeptidase